MTRADEWWRTAVIYQIYPRSFADADGDGIGDLQGITSRLPAIARLGVDAVWLSPFFLSPQRDAGYDVADYTAVDPRFGTMADFDRLIEAAHALGLRVIVDMVPNHTSSDHAWFQEAVAAGPGSAERDRYIFRDGKGPDGSRAPNNWQSVFGGSMWDRLTGPDGRPEQWYLHIFDSSQPDLNWEHPWVRERFRDILRFWLDRGVDGFRVDVAHGMIKRAGLPDYTPPKAGASMGGEADDPPYWGQDGVHEIWREWHDVLAEYPGDRVLCAEAWVGPLTKMALWVRPDEMHQAFNFDYMFAQWSAKDQRRVIDESIAAFGDVGAPPTWVLSNHDVIRHASRLALGADSPQGDGIGPKSKGKPDLVVGLRRGRAASALMLALPGGAYLYQGEELGLPEVIELPDSARQDPTWFRTKGKKYGRDGCRVPIPWEAGAPAYGFNRTGEAWLPQPDEWADYARDRQEGVEGSTLTLYEDALRLRRAHRLGAGELRWVPEFARSSTIIAFSNRDVTVVANLGVRPVTLPEGRVLLESAPTYIGANGKLMLPADATVWLAR
ncbi:MAG TPA: glycoside hydrolase family 13 protein [Microbacteriaceae bacterium]|nr:glycoside hydrolase family 13 protein [Microbacteriaceae bacterium]